MFEVTQNWKLAYPGASAGVLVMRAVSNPAHHPDLERRKAELEDQLRAQFSGHDRVAMASHPVLQAYDQYYRPFKKTYHIQLQLESIVLKGKAIPSVAALVESMFMAEMQDLLLTAGHDLDVLQLPLTLDVATGSERYTLLRGDDQILKPGDMMIRDQNGIISSIIYGPDQRTQSPLRHKMWCSQFMPRLGSTSGPLWTIWSTSKKMCSYLHRRHRSNY
jgi:DNA/RNA-binding domain of Phe-tRNA-synthetase-like protein